MPCGICFAEFCQDDGPGDAAVRGDRECVAGVEPVEDLHVGVIDQPLVGEVGLRFSTDFVT
jgi:hypothetical protein